MQPDDSSFSSASSSSSSSFIFFFFREVVKPYKHAFLLYFLYDFRLLLLLASALSSFSCFCFLFFFVFIFIFFVFFFFFFFFAGVFANKKSTAYAFFGPRRFSRENRAPLGPFFRLLLVCRSQDSLGSPRRFRQNFPRFLLKILGGTLGLLTQALVGKS